MEKQHSQSPPIRGGHSEEIVEVDGPSTVERRAGSRSRAHGSRVDRVSVGQDDNPWTGGGRGKSGDGTQDLVVGGGAVNRVARTMGSTSVR
jgi:hypothetical protein